MLTGKILLVEDDHDALLLIKRFLKTIGYQQDQIVECCEMQQLARIDHAGISMIITDLTLPDSKTEETFTRIRALFPHTPIIVVTGSGEKQLALDIIAQGADDYLLKGTINADVLERSIRYAWIRRKTIEDYRRLFDESPAPMCIFDASTRRFMAVNHAMTQQYGFSEEEFMQMKAEDIRPASEREAMMEAMSHVEEKYMHLGQRIHQRKGGVAFYVNVYARAITFEGRKAVLAMTMDVNEKVKAELELQRHLQEIEAQNQKLKQISWIQSHEMRRPVANILGLISLFNNEDPSDPHHAEIILHLKTSATMLDQMIRRITELTNDLETEQARG
ncbi:MAG TPA: PAS domain S-box protein [Chitinophagaceae bacterium]